MTSVRCVQCGHYNPPDSKFCVKCGSRLWAKSRDAPETGQSIQDEIRQLREQLTQISARLDVLEGKKETAPIPPPQPTEAAPTIEPTAVIPEGEGAPAPEPVAAASGAEAPPEIKAPKIPEEETIPPAREPTVKKNREWEQILGGNWLARIGVLALIIGIGFFLKYAFDNNWIGPTARVILGVVAGLVMLGLGYFWRRRYPIMTRVLSGGGIAVLYLSIFASFATYHLISIYLAIVFLLVISIFSTVLALRYDSMALAILGILGAFFAPFILGAFGRVSGGSSSGQSIQLLLYIIVIDLGVLVLSTFRNWRWFTLLSLACSLITFAFWQHEYRHTASIATKEIGITGIFLIFTGATYLFHIIRRYVPQAMDYLLMVFTAAAYTGISLGLMWHEFRGWMGGFILLLAIFYGLLSFFAYKRSAENKRLSRFSLAIAMIFLTAAIPVQFRDHATTTIVWAAEGAALMWLSLREKIQIFRIESYILFLLVAVRLLGFDTWLGSGLQPVFNERFLAFIFSIAFIWLVAILLWKHREDNFSSQHQVFIIAADFFALWLIVAEIIAYHGLHTVTSSNNLSLLILLVVAGMTMMNLIIWRREPASTDVFLAFFNAAAFVIASIPVWHDLRGWMGTAYLLPAVFYGILTYYAMKKNNNVNTLGNCYLIIAMAFLTAAIPIQFGDHAATTIAWAVEMTAFTWFSFFLKLPFLRYGGYAVFFAMAWRMLIFDTTVDISTFKPVLNERCLAFIIGIAAIYLTVYILWRKYESFKEWRFFASFLLITASFLSLWFISFEVWDSFSHTIHSAGQAASVSLHNGQNLSLTAVWAVYAVIGLIIGIKKHWRYVRIGALALLVVPIVKVFVYDVFKLTMGYRIGAFVGLGLLLLVSAYLYQRYSKIIKGVFIEK